MPTLSIWAQYIKNKIFLIFIIIICAIGLLVYINPFPPKQAYLATGQMGSSYKIIANQIDQFFSNKGIDLVLVDTSSLNEGLEKLRDEQSPINASFVTSGSANQKDFPDLVSLGSIQYSPIWIFYRGTEISVDNPIDYFGSKRISIGLPNSTTHNIFLKLAQESKFKSTFPNNFYEYSNLEASDKLIAGELDAVFIVDGIHSPSIQNLINAKNIKIYNFSIADAYEKKFPFLKKVILPKGSLNLEKMIPPQDIQLISSTVILLVQNDMHPVMQWSFMLAAKELGQSQSSFFSRPGFFPRDTAESFELSPIAKRYYESGVPLLFKYFPIWLASLINEIWFYVLSLFAIIYPLKNVLLKFREIPSAEYLENCFEKLNAIDHALKHSNDLEILDKNLERLDALDLEITNAWIDSSLLDKCYVLRNSIARIKNEGTEKILKIRNFYT